MLAAGAGPAKSLAMSAAQLYLEEVLGLRYLIRPPVKAVPPKVIFLIRHAFTDPAGELFLKMTEAMKLKPGEFLVFERDLPEALKACPTVVHFFALDDAPKHWFEIESPEILLSQPELKKKAWSDLQKVMKQISIVEAKPNP